MFGFKINGFRSFDSESFNFKRINILIGENSGGKSSLIKSLLALKQTLEYPDISNLVLNGKLTDLGNYKESIRNHEDDLQMEFSFSFNEDLKEYAQWFFLKDIDDKKRKKEISNYLKDATKSKSTASFKFNSKLDDHTQIETSFSNESLGDCRIDFIEENAEDEKYYDLVSPHAKLCDLSYFSRSRKKEIIFRDIEYSKRGFLSIIDPASLDREVKKTKDERFYYEIGYLLIIQNLIEYYLHNITYVNPLKSIPKRIYLNKDLQNEYEHPDLEKFTNIISSKKISKKSISRFDKILKEYGIADGVQVVNAKNLPVSEIKVQIKNLLSNIYDVGYGVSLQIPIIFEAFLAEEQGGETFIIEQPEIHLHPKLQAKFIETLLKLGNKNDYIIETHSEHIVRMLQVIVKDKALEVNENSVKIFYFQRNEEKFNVSEHLLDSNGKMRKEFPEGFFDASFNLTKKLMF